MYFSDTIYSPTLSISSSTCMTNIRIERKGFKNNYNKRWCNLTDDNT